MSAVCLLIRVFTFSPFGLALKQWASAVYIKTLQKPILKPFVGIDQQLFLGVVSSAGITSSVQPRLRVRNRCKRLISLLSAHMTR